MVQVAFAASAPPESVIVEEPGAAVTIPPQVFFSNGSGATLRPEGSGSVNAIPVIAEVAGL
jgi:hypothetical protein